VRPDTGAEADLAAGGDEDDLAEFRI
jgi:hypothetical protein